MTVRVVRGDKLIVDHELVTETCCNCGMLFAMPADFQQRMRKKRTEEAFYCPAGHGQHYTGGSAETKLRRENERLKQNEAFLEDQSRRALADAEHQRHRANGYKGHATRITKRAKAGVCPCCNRSFIQLARHMATQHPQFTPEAPEPPRVGAVN